MNGSEGKSQRSWEENVRVRGVAILLRLVMPIVHDKGDDAGRATKCRVVDIRQHPDGRFVFVLNIPDDTERGRLIGPKCLHLSALQILFSVALRATFPARERPNVVVGIWDAEQERVLMPQELIPESELEPEDEESYKTENNDD